MRDLLGHSSVQMSLRYAHRREAEQLEEELRRRCWRQIRLGEPLPGHLGTESFSCIADRATFQCDHFGDCLSSRTSLENIHVSGSRNDRRLNIDAPCLQPLETPCVTLPGHSSMGMSLALCAYKRRRKQVDFVIRSAGGFFLRLRPASRCGGERYQL